MLKSNLKLERESFYYVVTLSLIAFIVSLFLYFTSDKTLPVTFLTIITLLYFLFTLIHAEAVMGLYNAVTLKIIAGIITYAGEFLGVNYGLVFGSYYYTSALGFKIGGVPLLVILCWDVFIYTAYMLIMHSIPKINKIIKHKRLSFSLYIALLTGIATTAVDLFLDPLAVQYGWWVWNKGGSYFPSIGGGVPISNFVGWIFVPALAIFIYTQFFQRPYFEKESIFEYAPLIPYFVNFIAIPVAGISMNFYGPMFTSLFAMSIFILFFFADRQSLHLK